MENPKQNSLKESMVNWLAPRFEKFETIAVLAVLIIVLAMEIAGFRKDQLLLLSFGTLAYLYFLMAFAGSKLNATDATELAFHKLTMWSCSIGVLGILFYFMEWQNPVTMLTVSSATLAISLTVMLYFKNTKGSFAYATNRYLLRASAICLMGIAILLF